jgi:hypothetical protein
MARPIFATMLPLILVPCFLLFQVCHCSSRALLLNPGIQQQPLVPRPPPAAHHPEDAAAEAGARAVAAAIAEDDGHSSVRAVGAGAAPSSMATTASSPRDRNQQGGVVASSWPNRSALLAGAGPHQVLPRSKLARRFLVTGVVEGADSAARASCHSSDVHNSGCTPPSEH